MPTQPDVRVEVRALFDCFLTQTAKHVSLMGRKPLQLEMTDLLCRNLLKLVRSRFADENRDLIVSWRAAAGVSEFLNRGIPLGTAPTEFVEDLVR